MRTTLRPGSWRIEWKTLAFHGTRVGSVGKESLLKERRPLGRGAFGSLLVKGNKEVRIFCQTKENLKNQEIYQSLPPRKCHQSKNLHFPVPTEEGALELRNIVSHPNSTAVPTCNHI